jgi:lipopolysaccharide transport system permease protein
MMTTTTMSRPSGALAMLARNRSLIIVLAMRELRDRYAGSMLGALWAILQPLMLLAVFAAVFGFVFRARSGMASTFDLPTDYTSYMISGFVPWYALSAALQASASSLRSNAGLVKQIDFPVGVLPVKTVLTFSPIIVVGSVGLVLYQAIQFGYVPATLLLLPVAICLLFMLATGLGWILAAFGTYFRDLDPILANLFLVAFYLLPIFFVPGVTPEILEPLIAWNPFTPAIMVFQDVFVYATVRSPGAWLFFCAFAVVAFFGGYRVFDRLRPGFGAVL